LPRASPGAQPSRLHSATRTPTPGFANPGSADTRSRSNPRVTVERRPSSPNASRAPGCASRQLRPRPLGRLSDGASCPCPLSAAPRASLPLADPHPRRGADPLDLEDADLEPFTSSHALRRGVAAAPLAARDLTARFRIGRHVSGSRQPRDSDLPSRGRGRWWAPLLPGGPTLMGFRASSKTSRRFELAGGAWVIRPSGRSPTSASPRARRPVTGTPAIPLHAVLPPSRAPRAFARRGVPRSSLRFGHRARNRSALD